MRCGVNVLKFDGGVQRLTLYHNEDYCDDGAPWSVIQNEFIEIFAYFQRVKTTGEKKVCSPTCTPGNAPSPWKWG